MTLVTLNGSDTLTNLAQNLAPVSQAIGISSTGTQYILGVIVLVLLATFMAKKKVAFEVMAMVLFTSSVILAWTGWLPSQVAIAALFLAAGIISLALYNLFNR